MPTARSATIPVPKGARERADQRVVLPGISWEQYDALTRSLGDGSGVRTTYLDGRLEILMPGRQHEHVKTMLARLLFIFAEERGIPLNGFGSETLRKEARRSGLEPDECYCVGRERPVPDLAIEVVMTSVGVDKLEAYRRLGVGEVWFWVDDAIHVYRLARGRYERRTASDALPGLDLEALAGIVASTDRAHQMDGAKRFRRSLSRKR